MDRKHKAGQTHLGDLPNTGEGNGVVRVGRRPTRTTPNPLFVG